MATSPGQTLTDQQKLDLIRGTQLRMQQNLGIDPAKPFADNIAHMRTHPDAEIRRRFGNLGTAASTVDPVTRQRGLGEQTDLVAFAVRDIGAEAAKLDSYSRTRFIDDKYMKAQGFDDWMGPLKPGQVWRDDVDREAAQKVAELDARRQREKETPDRKADETLQDLGKPVTQNSEHDSARDLDQISDKDQSAPRETRSARGQGRRTPEERMERLDRLQDRVATALSDKSTSGWTQDQRKAAQNFVQADLSIIKNGNREDRQALAAQAREMRALLKNDRVAPNETFAPRVIDRQRVEASAGEPGERSGNREQRLERLENLQARVREAQSRGLSDGWSSEQKALAQNFADRNLRQDLQNGQRDTIRAEVQTLRPLLRGQNVKAEQEADVQAVVSPRTNFSTAAAFASSWNDKTRFPEAEPKAYQGGGLSVQVRPGGPSWNGSPGFGDRTDIPETKLPSYDVSIRRSSRWEFSNAATTTPSAPPARVYETPVTPTPQYGSYNRDVNSGITWSGGRLAPQFGYRAAGIDPDPQPGWPGRSAEGPSSPLGPLLQGAAAFTAQKHVGGMDWDDRRELRQGLRAAGFGPYEPVGHAAAALTGPLVKGLGL